MVITYHGGECFKVSQGDLAIAFNPPSKDSGIKVSKFGADVVLISLNSPDFNGADTASIGDKKPFVITGPGEYEVKGIEVRGFASDSNYGGKKSLNTIYGISLEEMNLCFLGAFGGDDLPHDAKQELDEIDVLFVPIGGGGVLDYGSAYKQAVQLEAKIIIPMHYPSGQEGIGQKDALKLFLKEAGAEDTKAIDRLTIKKKDLEGKEGDIVVLSAN